MERNEFIKELKKIVQSLGKAEVLHAKKVKLFSQILVNKIIEAKLFPNIDEIKGELQLIPEATYYHDIGKSKILKEYRINADIRTDAGKEVYRTHVDEGFALVDSMIDMFSLEGKFAEEVGVITSSILEHHERYDGKGFPNGLIGEEISLAGRITAVADQLDNYLTTTKDKEKISLDLAIDRIQTHKSTRFDPIVVNALVFAKDDIEDKLFLLENGSLSEIQTLEEKSKPIELFFRPIYDTLTRRVISYEVALQLHDKSYGNITKPVYLPVSEKYDLIKDLTDFEMKEIGKAYSSLLKKGVIFEKLYVSISTKYLSKKYAADQLMKILDDYQVNPAKICLMIQESLVAGLRIQVIENVELLRTRGFNIALYNFGSDYSTLSKLSDLKASEVVLSSDFTYQIASSNVIREVVRSITGLAKSLGMTVVASGIQTKNEETIMTELGVRYMEGAFYGEYRKERYIRSDSIFKVGEGYE